MTPLIRRTLLPAALFLAVLALTVPTRAHAGITDPLPPGFTAQPWSVPGVLNNGNLATAVMCTATAPGTVGVEVFAASGGPALAPVLGVNLSAGQTATFVTQDVSLLSPDHQLGLGTTLVQGSARVVATMTKLTCHAFIVNPGSGVYMSKLPIIKKTSQKGD